MKSSTLRPSQVPDCQKEPATFELWGAHYEVADDELAIAEELREIRAAIAWLEERVAEMQADGAKPRRPRRARSAVEPEVAR